MRQLLGELMCDIRLQVKLLAPIPAIAKNAKKLSAFFHCSAEWNVQCVGKVFKCLGHFGCFEHRFGSLNIFLFYKHLTRGWRYRIHKHQTERLFHGFLLLVSAQDILKLIRFHIKQIRCYMVLQKIAYERKQAKVQGALRFFKLTNFQLPLPVQGLVVSLQSFRRTFTVGGICN